MLHSIIKLAAWIALGALPLLGQTVPAASPAQAAKGASPQPAVGISAKPARTSPARKGKKPATKTATQVMPPQPIAPMTPELLPAEAPRVSYRNGLLTIDSQNSTLNDILSAVRRQTGAQIDSPPGGGGERVAAHLSGPPRQVIASLLDGSNVGYIIMASAENPNAVQKVVLTAIKPGGAQAAAFANPAGQPQAQVQAYTPTPEVEEESEVNDRNPQPQPDIAPPPGQGQPPDQQGNNPYVGGQQPRYGTPGQPPQQIPPQQVKTPDQLLQELQRIRQQQEQNQQNQQQNQPPNQPQLNPQQPNPQQNPQ